MPATSPLRLQPNGSLPPLALLVHWLRSITPGDVITLDRLPVGNGSIPDCLAGVGITNLQLTTLPIATPFRWQGWAGGNVIVNAVNNNEQMPVYIGELTTGHTEAIQGDAPIQALASLRLQDVHSDMKQTSPSVTWNDALQNWAHLHDADHTDEALPTLTTSSDPCTVWNPLPWQRRSVVTLKTTETMPALSIQDSRGRRHPAQLVTDADSTALITSFTLSPHERVDVHLHATSVPGCHWEVSSTVLDNGRVRAELDANGCIQRLCCDGRFVDWAGPGLQPLLHDTCTSSSIEVQESGPVRAKVAVIRRYEVGTLSVQYQLFAHEDVLRVKAQWNGEQPIALSLPITDTHSPLNLAGEYGMWAVDRRNSSPPSIYPGIRWAVMRHDDAGLAVLGIQPLTLRLHDGSLVVLCQGTVSLALGEGRQASLMRSCGRIADSLATPFATGDQITHGTPVRLTGDPVSVWWYGQPDGWDGELLVANQVHQPAHSVITIPTATEVNYCDLRGNPQSKLKRSPDGSDWNLDLIGGAIACLRWR